MDIEEAAGAAYKHGHLLDGDAIRSIIAAAYPWRPLTADVPRGVALELRVPGVPGPGIESAMLFAVERGDAHISGVSVAVSGDVFAISPGRESLPDLIEAGAEYRELLP
jgi:hypothetical protein